MTRRPFLEMLRIAGAPHPRQAPWSIGAAFMTQRPELAAMVGHCLILWSQLELEIAFLLAVLLKVETPAVVVACLALRRRGTGEKSTFATNSLTLDEQDRYLLAAVLKVVQSAEAERNALAYGCFGTSPAIPDGILWVSAEDNIQFMIDTRSPTAEREAQIDSWTNIAEKFIVYRKQDLNSICDQIHDCAIMVQKFCNYLRQPLSGPHPERRKSLYDHLCSLAPIQEAFRALETAQQK